MISTEEFIKDLRGRKGWDLFYEYPEESIKRIEKALKLQKAVEDTIIKDTHVNPDGICMREVFDPCPSCDEKESLQKLLEESK